jgi:hypothetical protein
MRALIWALFAVLVITVAFFVIPRVIMLMTTWRQEDVRIPLEDPDLEYDPATGYRRDEHHTP